MLWQNITNKLIYGLQLQVILFSFFIKITLISYFIEWFFPNFTCKFDIQICLSIRLSIALKLPITLTTRKKGEKTVAPRGPTPSFSRDVGGNQGKFLSEILYQNIMYELKKYFIWSVENRPMFLFYCNFSSNCWLLDMVVSICVATCSQCDLLWLNKCASIINSQEKLIHLQIYKIFGEQ